MTNRSLAKELEALLVWGGIHPTSYPEEAVRAVDAICMGEGDVSFLKLVQAVKDGRDFRKTRGFWFRDGDQVIRNAGEPLVESLDEIPFMDFEFEEHFVNDLADHQAHGHAPDAKILRRQALDDVQPGLPL